MSDAIQFPTAGQTELAASIARLREAANAESGEWSQLRGNLDELERNARALSETTQVNRLILAQALHDIRGTLTVLRMNADLLSRTLTDPRCGGLTRNILKACDDLVGLVVELILLSQTETPNLPPNPAWVNPAAELEPLLESYQTQARAKGLVLDWSIAPTVPSLVRIDGFQLRRALGNLLANAVKFTEEGRVCVSVAYEGDCLRIEVVDTGPGIPEVLRESIFEAYRHPPEARGKHGGGGLGLNVARRLSRGMGGDVLLQSSALGKGTCLLLTLEAESPKPT